MIAAIYARKSTDQNGVAEDQKSVARQVENARAYAAKNGWTVAEEHVYVDDGVSGAEFSARPGFVRLMASLKPKAPFDVLLMSEESRLGREQIEVSYALKQLITGGVRVHCYMTESERTLDSPIEKAMLALQAMADEMERAKAAARTKDALVRKAKAGHVCGGRTFGYDNVEILRSDEQRSHVERRINQEEAAVVRQIFQMCVGGLGKTRIAKTLNDEGAPSPRSQQGRPRAWAPSSVRAVLYRDLYRGLIVWNKSKKRDAWGQRNQRPRPESEWLEVEAPELRIVPQELWDAAHARLEATRKTYLRQQHGELWGRPPSGVASKYLLTGMARCGHCGAGLEVRSRAHGEGRKHYYSCSSYYRRGRSICPNRYEIPMKAADGVVVETLLEEILTPDRLATVVDEAVKVAQAEQETPDAKARIERQLSDTQAALDRLAAAVAQGGDVPSLVAAIQVEERRRRELERRLQELDKPAVTFDADAERRLRDAVGEWRQVLGRQVVQARQILQTLLAEKLTFSPEDREGRRGFRFQGTGTVEKLVVGVVPGSLQAVASPTGFEPVLPA